LRLIDISFDDQTIRNLAPESVSPTPKGRIHWNLELRALVTRLKYPALVRHGYAEDELQTLSIDRNCGFESLHQPNAENHLRFRRSRNQGARIDCDLSTAALAVKSAALALPRNQKANAHAYRQNGVRRSVKGGSLSFNRHLLAPHAADAAGRVIVAPGDKPCQTAGGSCAAMRGI
jgi:hypothetical protein